MNDNHRLMLELQKMQENKLSKELIVPLFRKMNYQKVEFSGGVTEEGKDIIIWDEDKVGDIKLIVAQVKHFKFTNKASDGKSLQTVINQLTTCLTKRILNVNKISFLPSEVFLITTFEIDTKTLHSRFDIVPTLKDQQIKIIDGLKLSNLLLKYSPEVVANIIGYKYEIVSKLIPKFSNEILLRALGKRNYKDIINIYTDIDFSVGRRSNFSFFNANFFTKKDKLEIKINDWDHFNNTCSIIKKEYSLDFILEEYNNIQNNINSLFDKALKLDLQIDDKDKLIEMRKKEIYEFENETTLHTNILIEIDKKSKQLEGQISTTNSSNSIKQILTQIRKNGINTDSIKEKINKTTADISRLKNLIFLLENEVKDLRNQKEHLGFIVDIDGVVLITEILNKRKWIEKQINEYNRIKPSLSTLKEFIRKCNSILNTTSVIFDLRNSKFFQFLGVENKNHKKLDESTRLKLTIEEIIDTGFNLTVLGDAGAGKSTSLEMYAWKNSNSDRLVFLFPLGYVVQTHKAKNNQLVMDDAVIYFENILQKYLNQLGISIDLNDFQSILNQESCLFLFDGLDEAIKVLPELPQIITEFAGKYIKSQIVLSSRMEESYTSDINFFTVTLLPFTTEQRNGFISKWFDGEINCNNIVEKIKLHLAENNEIGEIVKNPLLTTILCVLAENKLYLPRTELKLYDERLRLLTGYYDNVKHIITRVNSTPSTLEELAQKIAYILHFENIREDKLDKLKEKAFRLLQNKYSEAELELAINELISPCEILIPMTITDEYGFGHLRYQEHLAARELHQRSIDIVPLLSLEWWYGPLLLFSRMNDNIEWLIHQVCKKNRENLPIVGLLIKTRHKVEQENLNNLIDKYEKFYFDEADGGFY